MICVYSIKCKDNILIYNLAYFFYTSIKTLRSEGVGHMANKENSEAVLKAEKIVSTKALNWEHA